MEETLAENFKIPLDFSRAAISNGSDFSPLRSYSPFKWVKAPEELQLLGTSCL